MKRKASGLHFPFCDGLVCPECGNNHRFIQVMAKETHIVDASLKYIKLLEAEVDHYLCAGCGARIDMEEPDEP